MDKKRLIAGSMADSAHRRQARPSSQGAPRAIMSISVHKIGIFTKHDDKIEMTRLEDPDGYILDMEY